MIQFDIILPLKLRGFCSAQLCSPKHFSATLLIKVCSSGPVVAMVWEGLNAVKTGRVMLGATNPADSAPGTIRGDLCVQVGGAQLTFCRDKVMS